MNERMIGMAQEFSKDEVHHIKENFSIVKDKVNKIEANIKKKIKKNSERKLKKI